jgi:hypothetical protein
MIPPEPKGMLTYGKDFLLDVYELITNKVAEKEFQRSLDVDIEMSEDIY